MEFISHMRLINRALVKEGENDRLEYWNKIIEIAEEYDIAIRGGTYGDHIEGPFIEAIYTKRRNDAFEVSKFARFLNIIADYLDMYNGVKPYTKMEFSIKFVISKDRETIKKQTQLGVWYDLKSNKTVLKAVNAEESPMIKIPPRLQLRLTQLDIEEAIKNKLIFTKSVDTVSVT